MAYAKKRNFTGGNELVPSTLRDHSGGLNKVDNEQNLNSKYQVVLNNMYRAASGAISKRFGTRLFANIEEGVELPITETDAFYAEFAVSTSTTLVLRRYLHGMSTGDLLTLSGFTEDFNGIPFADLNDTFSVTVIDPDRISITLPAYTPDGPTIFGILPDGVMYSYPSDNLSGDIVGIQYYNSRLVVVTDEGEVGTVTGAGTVERIWPLASTALFDVTNAQANGALTFSIDIGGDVVITAANVSAATSGATLASIIDALLKAIDLRTGASWAGDVLTITDTRGRAISSGHLIDGVGEIDASITYNNATPWTNGITFASFAEFGGELYICDGIDKPLLVADDFTCNYVLDLGTSSNAFTPVAKYICTSSGYLLMAGDALAPNTLYISCLNAGGTWEGDPDPNDATSIDLSKKAGTSTIRGIARFRDKVLVAFDDRFVVVTLGIYNTDGDHTPSTDDIIEENGSISHKTMISTGDELLVCDNSGVPSVSQALFTGTLRPKRASYLIAPDLKDDLRSLSTETLDDRVFAVYNKAEDQYMLFVPNANTLEDTTETKCWVYTTNPTEKISHWAVFRDWNFQAGCVSKLGRVFLCQGANIFVYGSRNDMIYADYINLDGNADGDDVDFTVEWPWSDFGERTKKKKSRYTKLETTGTSRFTLRMYVDNKRYDVDGNDDPTLSMEFVGGGSGGYGSGSQPFGGGRRSADERPWRWKSDFNIAKMSITGSSSEALGIVSISILRIQAGIRR